ncbi:MAG: hypothetical protein D6806_16585 [Deltaproteobacteria bacterium]|nr:MAG: hypothetical protein D6806_16585 [Deltaproteobacteria bacterium]
MKSTAQVKLAAAYEARRLWGSAHGILALCFLIIYAGWILTRLGANSEFIDSLSSGNWSEGVTFLIGALEWIAKIDRHTIDALLVHHSPFITIMFVMLAFVMPAFTMVAGMDQNASSIGSRGIRFLLPRASRTTLVLGSFLGHCIFWCGLVLALGVMQTAMAMAWDTHHTAGSILMDGLGSTLALMFMSVPFVALMSLCSVSGGNPLLSFTIGLGSYLVIALMSALGKLFNEGMKAVGYLFPSPFRYDLFLGDGTRLAMAAGAMVLYTVAYLAAALMVIHKRDL